MKGPFALLPLILALSTPLPAAPPDPAEQRSAGGPNRQIGQRLFKKLDADQSNDISQVEFQAHPRLAQASDEQKSKLFQRLDKNGDGVLHRRELRSPRGGGKRGPRYPEGPMTFEQFAEQPHVKKLDPQQKRKLFKRLDRNRDQVLSREDSRQGPPRRQNRGKRKNGRGGPLKDLNNDGEISFDEFTKHPHHRQLGEDAAEDLFEELDSDSNGLLSPAEVSEFEERPPQRSKKKSTPQRKSPPAPAEAAKSEMMNGG